MTLKEILNRVENFVVTEDMEENKIMDFFVMHAFIDAHSARQIEHIADPRFRGVYFLLADWLPLDAAEDLQQELIYYAADTNDHTVSDTFVQIIRSRKVKNR